MGDTVVVDTGESDDDSAADVTIAAVAETAEDAADAEHAAEDAEESADEAEVSADIAEMDATIAVGAAIDSAESASEAADARDQTLLAVSELSQNVTRLIGLMESKITEPADDPEPVEITPDEPPQREHWLKRRWGASR